MNTLKRIIPVALVFLPAFAFAQGNLNNLQTIVRGLGTVVNLLIPIAFAAAVVFFFWGLALYILNAGNEEKKAEGRRIMIGGVIALFIMASIWGIVAFLRNALGVGTDKAEVVPTVR